MDLLDIGDYALLAMQRHEWVDQALAAGLGDDERDPRWTGGIAVGTYDFVEAVQLELGYVVKGRSIVEYNGSCVLREE